MKLLYTLHLSLHSSLWLFPETITSRSLKLKPFKLLIFDFIYIFLWNSSEELVVLPPPITIVHHGWEVTNQYSSYAHPVTTVLLLNLPYSKACNASKAQSNKDYGVFHFTREFFMLGEVITIEHSWSELEEELQVFISLLVFLVLGAHEAGLILGDDT